MIVNNNSLYFRARFLRCMMRRSQEDVERCEQSITRHEYLTPCVVERLSLTPMREI